MYFKLHYFSPFLFLPSIPSTSPSLFSSEIMAKQFQKAESMLAFSTAGLYDKILTPVLLSWFTCVSYVSTLEKICKVLPDIFSTFKTLRDIVYVCEEFYLEVEEFATPSCCMKMNFNMEQ